VKSRELVRRHPVLAYFILAFTISWVGCLLAAGPKFIRGETMGHADALLVFLTVLLVPSLSGVALTAFLDRRSGLRDLCSRILEARVGAAWYATLLVFPILIAVVIVALRLLVSEDFALGFELLGMPIGLMAGFFEEIGWTGFALPRMLGKRSALLVAVVLGLLQTSWHVVADFLTTSGSRGGYWMPHFAAFFISMIAMRVFVVWVYANTRSLLLGQLVHTNSIGFLAVLVPLSLSPAQDTLFYVVYSVTLRSAVAIVVTVFGKNLVRAHAG